MMSARTADVGGGCVFFNFGKLEIQTRICEHHWLWASCVPVVASLTFQVKPIKSFFTHRPVLYGGCEN